MATASDLRRLNQRRVFRALLSRGAATRADLARAVGLSQPAAGAIVDDLLAANIIEQTFELPPDRPDHGQFSGHRAVPGAAARMGRPGQLVRLDRTRRRFLAVELGVTHTRLARLPVGVEDGDWDHQMPTPRTAAEWVKRLAKAIKTLPNQPTEAVLLSLPGVVDERKGQSLLCPNLRWVEKADLSKLIGGVCVAPALIVQEIRALALGQLALDPTGDDFLLVDIGDGVGGAVVVGGRLFESSLPLSGELGHDPVLGNHRICGCGAVGCIETLVARRGLLTSFAAAGRSGPYTWSNLVRDVTENGIPPWLRNTLDALAITIAGALNLLGVRRVIITGILNEFPEPVMTHLSQAITAGTMWARFGEVTCEARPRKRLAGLVSAAIDRLLLPEVARQVGRA